MNTPTLETERLILRKFTENDIEALLLILKDRRSQQVSTLVSSERPLRKPEDSMRKDMQQNTDSHKRTLMPSA